MSVRKQGRMALDDERYPDVPGHRGVATSIEAAESISSKCGRLQRLTLEAIGARQSLGLTADECAEALGNGSLVDSASHVRASPHGQDRRQWASQTKRGRQASDRLDAAAVQARRGMSASVNYQAIRCGRVVQIALGPASESERQHWRELGEDLHRKMEAAIAEAHLSVPDHPHDDEHDIAVGRAMSMIAAGDVQEGAAFYNAWADANGYPGVSIIRWEPPQLDIGTSIGGMVAEMVDGDITILTAGPEWVRPGYVRIGRSFAAPTHLWSRLIVRAEP